MTAIVPGVYKQGKLELLQTPVGLREGPVRVVLIEEGGAGPRQLLTYGKYTTGRLSTLDDFWDAEWRGEAEFDERHGEKDTSALSAGGRPCSTSSMPSTGAVSPTPTVRPTASPT